MITHDNSFPSPVSLLKRRFPRHTRLFATLIVLALFTLVGTLQAQSPDDEYLKVMSVVEQADSLREGGQTDSARTKYQEAQTALLNLKKNNPVWNTKVVSYRLNYIAEKIAALSSQPATTTTNTAPTPATATTNAASTPQEAKPTVKPPAALSPSISVKLLAAGAEPRKALRIHVTPGKTQTVAMTMKTDMTTEMGGMPVQAMKLPAMTIIMESTVKNVSADGDITYETVIKDASVADEAGGIPGVAEAMKASLGGMKGLTTIGTMTTRGFNKATEVKMPPGANPQTRQYMEQMKDSFSSLSAPLPEEAVGPGAKWESKLPIKSQGMTITQTATYELVSIEGDRLNMKATIAQHAANQKVENPAMPNLKVDVTKMTGTGNGNVTFDLAKLLPSTANIDSHTEMVMGMDMGGEKQTMTMKMDMNIQMDGK